MPKISDWSSLAGWNMSNVQNTNIMFANDTAMTNIAFVQNWDISSCEDIGGMFWNTSITDITPVSKWNTTSLTHVNHVFAGTSVVDFSPIANWDTSKVYEWHNAFADNSKITDGKNFKTIKVSSVKCAKQMFVNDTNLKTLDISTWDMSDIGSILDFDSFAMFANCPALQELTVGSKTVLFDTAHNLSSELCTPPSNDMYTGKWTKKDPYNHTDAISTDTLIKKYTSETAKAGTGEKATWVWEKKSTITFDKNGGIGGTDNVKVDSSLPNITPPTRTGYTFDGYAINHNLFKNAQDSSKFIWGNWQGPSSYNITSGMDSAVPSGNYSKIEWESNDGGDPGNGFFLTHSNYDTALLKKGDTVTVSFYLKVNRPGISSSSYMGEIEFDNNCQRAIPEGSILPTNWKRYAITVTCGKTIDDINNGYVAIDFYPGHTFQKGDALYISSPKIERGSKCTPWTPSLSSINATTEKTMYYNSMGESKHAYDLNADSVMEAQWTPNTYTISIPKAVSYKNMSVGKANTSDPYDISVKHKTGSFGETVTVSSQASNLTASDGSQLQASASSATEPLTFNTDGAKQDTVKISGDAQTASKWKGYLQYSVNIGQ